MTVTDSDSDSDSDSDTDTDSDSDTGEADWLIHVSDNKLWHITLDTGKARHVCDLIPDQGVTIPSFQSVTFTRDDRLVISSTGDNSLWELLLPS